MFKKWWPILATLAVLALIVLAVKRQQVKADEDTFQRVEKQLAAELKQAANSPTGEEFTSPFPGLLPGGLTVWHQTMNEGGHRVFGIGGDEDDRPIWLSFRRYPWPEEADLEAEPSQVMFAMDNPRDYSTPQLQLEQVPASPDWWVPAGGCSQDEDSMAMRAFKFNRPEKAVDEIEYASDWPELSCNQDAIKLFNRVLAGK